MSFIDRVLSRPEFNDAPPVLIDVGASGGIHRDWRALARHSVCVAFDADTRELGCVVKERAGFRRLHVFNCAVVDREVGEVDFHLTRFPYCSSALRPDTQKLRDWAFADLFATVGTTRVKAKPLPAVLQELGLTRVDWFKTDSQGMDLRLFRSMGEPLLQKVLAADFEPGIIDAYEGEDKLHSLLAFMDSQPFFVSRVRVRGSQRLNRSVLRTSYSPLRLELLVGLTRQSPGWAEVSYLNDLRDRERFGQRERLLQIVFAVIQEQFGFALELAVTGFDQSGDPLFRWCQKRIMRRMLLCQLKKGFFAGLGVHLLKTALMPLYAKRR